MELYRITHDRWSRSLTASGRSARWNSNLVDVIYTASSRSLACLENVVHRDSSELSALYKLMVIYVPNQSSATQVSVSDLGDNWNETGEQSYKSTRILGDQWARSHASLLLKVPSVIVPNEFNFLINPYHPEFAQAKIIDVETFKFDFRIKK